jgi:hypothetical protein
MLISAFVTLLGLLTTFECHHAMYNQMIFHEAAALNKFRSIADGSATV